MQEINFETDVLKHYVRKHGWIKASRHQKQAIRNRSKKIPLRYFTFCAAEAIDVFMLVHEGIISRSNETGRLEGVYFCEENESKFGIISELIGSPEQGFQGEFQKIVLFNDTPETVDKKMSDENFYSEEIRRILRIKDANERLINAFPFDIINLDVCGVMFPPKSGVFAPILESIVKMLEWQTKSQFSVSGNECKNFTLFLTTHVDKSNTNNDAIHQLRNKVEDNIKANFNFQKAFEEKFGHDNVEKLTEMDYPTFLSIGLPKYIIHEALFTLGWKVTCGPTFLYSREYKREKGQYQIMHTISHFERIPNFNESLDKPSTIDYFNSVTQLVKDTPIHVEKKVENPDICAELTDDLKQIRDLRDMKDIE